jgi:excisionase family DNA binding protein
MSTSHSNADGLIDRPWQTMLAELRDEVRAIRQALDATGRRPTPREEQFIAVKEVAELLGVGVTTVWRLSANGKLPQPHKIGRSSRWRRDQLLGYVKH